MKRNYIMLIMVFFSFFVNAEPKFVEYKVDSIYVGENSALKESPSGNTDWDALRIAASEKKVNFSGHYVIFTGSCGGGAICGEIFDVTSGKIVSTLPDEYDSSDDQDFFYLNYKADSRLIEIAGKPIVGGNNRQGIYKTRYYEFKNNKFISIRN